jgi:hypothetical protein
MAIDPHANERKAALLAQKLCEQLTLAAGKGVNEARILVVEQLKEALSVPRRRVANLRGAKAMTRTPRNVGRSDTERVTGTMLAPNTALISLRTRGRHGPERPSRQRWQMQVFEAIGRELRMP